MNLLILLSASVVALLSIFLLPSFTLHKLGFVSMMKSSTKLTESEVGAADLVVTNALIYTSNSSLPFAEAMAIHSNRVIRIGNLSYVQELLGDGTKELDLQGKIVVPGFFDSHAHLISGGLQMEQVVLYGVTSREEFVQKVEEALEDKHQGCWILGGGWNHDLWGGDLPTASWIDNITPNNPVWLSRMDGHMGVANSLALKISGITKYTEDPVGGTVVKTATGEPTGLLIDSAMKLLFPFIPKASVEDKRNALVRASEFALTRGVTTVVDFGRFFPGADVSNVWEDFSDVYQWADSKGQMLIRVCLFFPMETWSRLLDLVSRTGRIRSEWLYLGGVKAFADGSLGSNSALFHEPYVDEPDNYGLQVTQLDVLHNMTLASDKSGLQVAIHAIGDKANDLILDLYKSVESSNGKRHRRFRVEHAQHLAPGSVTRFGELSIIASVQPDHLLGDAETAEKKLGAERAAKGPFMLRSLLASKAKLAFGSDWPVAKINPLGAIKTSMRRIPPGWEKSWIESECITLDDALKASTISAAYASFLDNDLGSLSPGKLADFVVLSTSSWDDLEAEVSASVEATFVGGIQAYPRL